MGIIVAKFGGTSLASATQIKKAADIIRANPDRRYLVASAPGKRDKQDTKVTDMLYRVYELASAGQSFTAELAAVQARYEEIAAGLGVFFDAAGEIEQIAAAVARIPNRDYLASRGEYLNSKLIASYLGFAFVDAADYIRFDENGKFDSELTHRILGKALEKHDYAVIPGFYGALPDGSVHTFSRGGSDVTGAIVARAVGAELYENWTDVSGMLAADPRIVDDPRPIDYISYKELRELSFMGASVLHEDAVFPVRKAGIPINIRNTNRPDDVGTMIVAHVPEEVPTHRVTGIAGQKGFSSIHIEKSMMNTEVGFGARLLQIFAENNVPFEHAPTGIDEMAVIVGTKELNLVRDKVLTEIRKQLDPDDITVEDGMAIIAVVGRGMQKVRGTAGTIFNALGLNRINVHFIDQGPSEIDIIIGVDERDYEESIRAIHRAMC